MKEVWKDIKGYEGLYQISNFGRVFSVKRKLYLKPRHNTGSTYQYVILYNKNGYKNFRVHHLVASHFIPKPKNKDYVNHLDGNKENNSMYNLEWCTTQENIGHSIYVLHHTNSKGVTCLETKQVFHSIKDAAHFYNLDSSSLGKHLKNRIGHKTFAGYHWKYV